MYYNVKTVMHLSCVDALQSLMYCDVIIDAHFQLTVITLCLYDGISVVLLDMILVVLYLPSRAVINGNHSFVIYIN